MGQDVFISYSTSDSSVANAVRKELHAAGYSCWMAPDSVPPGVQYPSQIADAITNCKITVILVSKAAQESRHVNAEVNIAFNHRKTIVPVRLDTSVLSKDFEYFIGTNHWIDTQGDLSRIPNDVLAAVRRFLSDAQPAMLQDSRRREAAASNVKAGDGFMQSKDYERALAAYRDACQDDPQNFYGLFGQIRAITHDFSVNPEQTSLLNRLQILFGEAMDAAPAEYKSKVKNVYDAYYQPLRKNADDAYHNVSQKSSHLAEEISRLKTEIKNIRIDPPKKIGILGWFAIILIVTSVVPCIIARAIDVEVLLLVSISIGLLIFSIIRNREKNAKIERTKQHLNNLRLELSALEEEYREVEARKAAMGRN